MTVGILTQLRHDIPWLQLSRQFTLVVTWLASTVGVAVTMLWSLVIGHPLPFSMLLGAPPWLAIQVACVYWCARDVLREQPRLQQYLVGYGAFRMAGLSLTVVYPMYVYAFTSIRNGMAQSAFVLVLPLIKVVIKFTMGRCLRDLDDLKPVALIFTADIFHALFVSYAMQDATSLGTVLVLIAMDLLHMGLTYRDVNRIIKDLDIHRDAIMAAAREDARKFTVVETNVLSVAEKILGRNAMVKTDHTIRLATWVHKLPTESSSQRGYGFVGIGSSASSAAVVKPDLRGSPVPPGRQALALKPVRAGNEEDTNPGRSPTSTESAWVAATHTESHSTDAVALVRKTLQLLYMSEFIVLIEYVEIVVPLIFNCYMFAMFYLPNRAYYPLLRSMSDAKLRQSVVNVSIYALLEIVSFVVMSTTLWRKLRFSVVYQLAFVLDKHWVRVQSGFMIIVVFVVSSSLDHMGFDYTFKFAWLHHQPISNATSDGTGS